MQRTAGAPLRPKMACQLVAAVGGGERLHTLASEDGSEGRTSSKSASQLFLSTGVLERPYCQMEIRHALALKKPVVLVHGECEDEPRRTRARTKAASEP